ncbi:DUF4412 domain-containing protein [Flavobacteriaceae bacterium F08102]|nr:DUF4412 domain-containing protein [Flavobacteriaceae bacterium F08102]
MKNTTKKSTITYFSLILIALFSIQGFAQKEIKEGYIIQKMQLSTGDATMDAQIQSMMGELTSKTFFKNQLSSTTMNNPMAGNTKTIVDLNKKKMIIFMDNPMLGKKYKEDNINLSEDDLKNVKFTSNGKTKTILGYTCNGYDASAEVDGNVTNMILYVTEQIKAPTQYAASFGEKLKGFPMFMEMSMNQGGMDMTMQMEVTEIKAETVADKEFDMTIPEGYSEIKM